MSKKEKRFEVIEKEGNSLDDDALKQIIVDKQTGVNYLWVKSGFAGGFAGGLTPLLDADGKPIVTK
jgi:hypothetical protein